MIRYGTFERIGGILRHLKVSYQLFHDGLPCDETIDENVGGTKVMWGDVLLDERLGTRNG